MTAVTRIPNGRGWQQDYAARQCAVNRVTCLALLGAGRIAAVRSLSWPHSVNGESCLPFIEAVTLHAGFSSGRINLVICQRRCGANGEDQRVQDYAYRQIPAQRSDPPIMRSYASGEITLQQSYLNEASQARLALGVCIAQTHALNC